MCELDQESQKNAILLPHKEFKRNPINNKFFYEF